MQHVTGVTSQASDLVGKRLQIVRDLLPAKRTLGVLLNPDTPFSTLALQEAPFGALHDRACRHGREVALATMC
jgi:ABC-type uncharacterized transport system substrate-binding protein